MDAQLDERKVTILKAIIKTYLDHNFPFISIPFFPLMILNSMTKYAPSVSGNVQDMENPGHVHRQ